MKNQEVIEALNGLLGDIAIHTKERYDDEIRSWLMAAALRIWAGNKLLAEDYIRVLPVFKGQEYTAAQVITALDCAGDDTREMKVPEFFQDLVKKDKEKCTSESRSIADSIGRFLAMMALVNGDFTIEEANALRSISDILLEYCDSEGVAAGKTREHHPEMVTPLSKTGYYQQTPEVKNNTLHSTNKVDSIQRSSISPIPKTDDTAPTITLNLNIVPQQSDENDSAASESGVAVKNLQVKRKVQRERRTKEIRAMIESVAVHE